MLKLHRYKLFAHALFLAGCLFPLTFLRIAFNFQFFDLALLVLYVLFSRKTANLFALACLFILSMLSLLALLINDRHLRDAFETTGDLLQIAFLLLIVLPLFRSMDDELHRRFFRGFVLATTVLAALMLSEALHIARWPMFEEMYLQQRWSVVGMEPNSTARIFFTAFAALFVIGDGKLLRGFSTKAVMGLLLLAAGVLTGSRTFYVALVALGLLFTLLGRHKILSMALLFVRRYWISLALIAVLALAALNQPPVQRFVSATLEKAFGPGRTTLFTAALNSSTGLTSDSDSQRVFLFKRSADVFFQNFFLGMGLSMSIYGFNDIPHDNIWTAKTDVVPTVHNAFVGFALDTGIVGVILMLFLAARLMVLVYHCPRKELVALLTVLVFDLTSTLQWTRMNWVPVLAFVTWSLFLLRQRRETPGQVETIAAPMARSAVGSQL